MCVYIYTHVYMYIYLHVYHHLYMYLLYLLSNIVLFIYFLFDIYYINRIIYIYTLMMRIDICLFCPIEIMLRPNLTSSQVVTAIDWTQMRRLRLLLLALFAYRTWDGEDQPWEWKSDYRNSQKHREKHGENSEFLSIC